MKRYVSFTCALVLGWQKNRLLTLIRDGKIGCRYRGGETLQGRWNLVNGAFMAKGGVGAVSFLCLLRARFKLIGLEKFLARRYC